MKVYVLSQKRTPLMPTTPRRARIWLKTKQAHTVSREPFTIQLHFATLPYTQPVTVGVDPGSQTVGLAALTNGEVFLQAEVHLRTDISKQLTQRRAYRRNRRSRKTRYRPARFANRRRQPGWLAPSLRSKAQATVKAVQWMASLLPVRQVKVEIASFDTQKMQNPEIAGQQYQQGELQGYRVREYVLAKWQRRCSYCGATGLPLQLEHIVPLSRGGSNRVSNLALACKPCNLKKGSQTASEFGHPKVQAQAKIPLTDTAHVSSLSTAVVRQLQDQFGQEQVQVSYGYQTKYKRIQVLDLPKSHTNDAIAIACSFGEVVKPSAGRFHLRCVPRGRYQLYNGKRSEHKVWAPRKVKGWKLFEKVQAKGSVGYIGGRRLKGSFVVKDLCTGRTVLEVASSKLLRLARPTDGWIIASMAEAFK